MPLNPTASAFVPNISAPVFIPGAPFNADQDTAPPPTHVAKSDKEREAMRLVLNADGRTASGDSPKPLTPTFNARMAEIHTSTPKGESMRRALPRVDSDRALDQITAEETEEDIFSDSPCLIIDSAQVEASGSVSPRDQWVEPQEQNRPELIWSSTAPVSSEGEEASEDGSEKQAEEREEQGHRALAEVEEGGEEGEEEEGEEGEEDGRGDEEDDSSDARTRNSKGDSDASASETVAERPVGQKARVTVEDFEILHMIGEGGFGKVYQVKKLSSGKVYAMKAMRKEVVIKDNLRGTKAERSIMSSVRHPYIVNMHYAFQCKGRLYLIMDYFPGGQFLDMLVNFSPFEPDAYTLYTAEVMLALDELHSRSIVHRDLKPENILVDAAGHLVVTDFGCSKMPEEAGSPVRTRSWAGTELYMAPEQLQKEQYGQEVDWWALGALVWEMVTGDNPFYHKNRKVVHNNILKKKLSLPSFLPKEVHSFVKGLLTRDPSKRLGANGASEVKAHPFFNKIDLELVMKKEIAAPLRSSAELDNPLDVSAHNARYTKAAPCLSPLLSPAMAAHDHHFKGFSWAAEDVLVLPPPQQAAVLAARRASRMSVNNLDPQPEERAEDDEDESADGEGGARGSCGGCSAGEEEGKGESVAAQGQGGAVPCAQAEGGLVNSSPLAAVH